MEIMLVLQYFYVPVQISCRMRTAGGAGKVQTGRRLHVSMTFDWMTFAWELLNLVIMLLLCAIPVALFVWLVQEHKRLVRIETAVEELRNHRTNGDRGV
jgi:hypothetical protein